MKMIFKKYILLFFLLNIKNVYGAEYTISSYNELMNLNPISGDTIIINGIITLDNHIKDKFNGLDLTFQGKNENSGFDGDEKFYGFLFNTTHTVIFKNLIFENFKNTEFGGVVGYDGNDENLHFLSASGNNIIFRNNLGDSNGTLYSFAGKLQLFSENSGMINFINNSSKLAGGAITIERNALLEIETNSNGQVNFINNKKFFDTTGSGSIFDAGGGAIFNNESRLNIRANSGSINFINNTSISGQGGAIYNFDGINFKIESNNDGSINFINNIAEKNGGAIFNNAGNIDLISNSGSINFLNNQALENGGAIFLFDSFSSNTDQTINIISNGGNINFVSNSAKILGGAIYNQEDGNIVNIIANNGNINFSDNLDSTGSNAIYFVGSNYKNTIINLNSSSNNSITFNDSINGSEGGSKFQILNINKNESSKPTDGEININDKISNTTVNIYDGIINLGKYKNRYGYFDNSVILNLYGGDINLFNNHKDDLKITTLDGNINLGVEIDIGNLKNSDTISKDNDFNYISGNINISKIKLINEKQNDTTINIDEVSDLSQYIKFSNNLSVNGDIFNYEINYDSDHNNLTFHIIPGTNGYNKEILGVPISVFSGNYISQLNIYNQILNFDFNESNLLKFYFKPFFSNENISLKYNLTTKTNSYGGVFGFDSNTIYLTDFYDVMATFGLYTGYVGSNSKFNGLKNKQDGTLLGLKMNFLINKNFFTTFVTNIILFNNKIKYNGIDNEFNSYLTSFALKTGYNFTYNINESKLFTLQPSIMLSYSLIDNNDYITQSNVLIKTNNTINILTISPEIRLNLSILNNTFMPYFSISGFFNINNTNNFKANSIKLIDYMLKNYGEYTIGFDKFFINKNLKVFSSIGYRSGGRDGINLNLGIKAKI